MKSSQGVNPIPSGRIQRILFATDFSEFSDRARDYTLYLAARLGSRVDVLHIIERVLPRGEEDGELHRWYEKLEKNLATKLEAELSEFRRAGIEVSGEMFFGDPWRKIIETADDKLSDLIIIGSHGVRTREGRFLLGTTSHKVAMASPRPVLIIRGEESREDKPRRTDFEGPAEESKPGGENKTSG